MNKTLQYVHIIIIYNSSNCKLFFKKYAFSSTNVFFAVLAAERLIPGAQAIGVQPGTVQPGGEAVPPSVTQPVRKNIAERRKSGDAGIQEKTAFFTCERHEREQI